MLSLIRTVINTARITLPKIQAANYHYLTGNGLNIFKKQNSLLEVNSTVLIPSCGLKVVGKPRRRCKDCYFLLRFNRLHVMCKTHPRHKQVKTAKDPKNTWILSHATQCKVRPW